MSKPGRYLGTDRAQVFEAGACWFERRAWAEGGGRESPGMRVTFFRVAERKSPKKGRPPVCDPCAALRGKPASGRLRGAPWNSLCAARAARTTTASQFTKHARSDARATPQPPRRRRSQQGVDSRTANSQQPNSPTGLCFARPPLAGASATRCTGWAERSNSPCGYPLPRVPFWMRLGRAGRGVACVPKDTHAS